MITSTAVSTLIAGGLGRGLLSTMSLAEPIWLLIWGAALIGAAALMRSRRRSAPMSEVRDQQARVAELGAPGLEAANG